MSDLVEFLLARFDEDEAVARQVIGGEWPQPAEWQVGRDLSPGVARAVATVEPDVAKLRLLHWGGAELAAHVARWDPARVLAELEAKRRIIEWPTGPVLRLLALSYADHRDYREEWRV